MATRQTMRRCADCNRPLRQDDSSVCERCKFQRWERQDQLNEIVGGLDDGLKIGDRVSFTGTRLIEDGPFTSPNRTAEGTWHGTVISNYGREVHVRFDDQREAEHSVFNDFGMRLVKQLGERGAR